ncbi:ORF6N domain-containing protein [Draconibacterium sediminis]|uniref:DNA-binding protein n=1 Tax=Draconibacterium sediminis TaxID=1544798 RepID=A0A0D8J7X9_9BACT|nr:ORF6N domain-containing protein [Draconibacterium sediminis]KJF41898.1 DNA-binding protein [Draconibacterium sediminis]
MAEKKQESSMLPDEIIMNKIYFIREQKVMLDSDLAELYGVETRRLNEQVKRNISRFPEDFMFQLSEFEFENLKSQFATSSWGGRRKLPNVFAEHGVLMLSSVLNSEKAIKVNIQIMRIFTKVRETLTDNLSIKLDIEEIKNKLANQDKNIELVFQYLDELIEKQEEPVTRRQVGYKRNNES